MQIMYAHAKKKALGEPLVVYERVLKTINTNS